MDLYHNLLWLQGFSVVFLLIAAGYLFSEWRKKDHSYLFMYCVATLVNNTGYLLEMMGTNSEAALAGTKLCYLGKVFVPLTLFLYVTSICDVKVPMWLKSLLYTIHTSVFFLVLTSHKQNLFYTSITYTTEGIFPHNVAGHGIVYKLYSLLLVVYLISFLIISSTYAIKEKNEKKRKRLYIIMACSIIAILGFAIFLTGITKGYDTTAIAFLICLILMSVATVKYDLLDTSDIIKEYISDNLLAAVIAVDMDGQIVFFNKPALAIYPNLEEDSSKVISALEEKIKEQDFIKEKGHIYKPQKNDLLKKDQLIGRLYVIDDFTDEYNYSKKLKKVAITDALTGLYNRGEISSRITRSIERVKENYENSVSLIMIDIDDFKSVNDSFGHDVGDNVIRGLARIIIDREMEDKQIAAGRWGGEEFMLALTGKSFEETFSIANEIRKAFEDIDFDYAGHKTVSLGVTEYHIGDSLETFTKRVDEALYLSKQNGKNQATRL